MPSPTDPPLFEPTPPFDTGSIAVGQGHRLYFEQSGDPAAPALLLLHGGPGSRSSAAQRRFFDPGHYRIVQFDQRGCGASEPPGETRHNHTAALVADIEHLRRQLGIARWLVVGGSWGATLAVAYAAAHPARIAGVLLRALFLAGRSDLGWFFGGAGALFPDAWQRFLEVAPRSRRRRLQDWLWQVFATGDAPLQRRVARAWAAWEQTLAGDPAGAAPAGADAALVQRYRVQAHYLARACFLGEAGVLGAVSRLHGLPVALLHGRQDLICRPVNSWRAWRSLTGSRLQWVEGAGHDPFAPAMAAAMRAAAAVFAERGDFDGLGALSVAARPVPRAR